MNPISNPSERITEHEFNQQIEKRKMDNPELDYSEIMALVVEEYEIDLNDINKYIGRTLKEKMYHELRVKRMIDRDKKSTNQILLDI